MSLIPGKSASADHAFSWLLEKTPTVAQKLLHVCLYGLLTLLLVWTLDAVQPSTSRFLIAFCISVAFGAVMEWCQTRVPGRFGALSDVALNAAGAGLGLAAAILLL